MTKANKKPSSEPMKKNQIITQRGFTKLQNCIVDMEWYQDAVISRIFIHCLIRANYKDTEWNGRPLKRGSFVGSIATLGESLKLSAKEVRRAITYLKKIGELETQSTNKYTVYTLTNYELWTGCPTPDTESDLFHEDSDLEVSTEKKKGKQNPEKRASKTQNLGKQESEKRASKKEAELSLHIDQTDIVKSQEGKQEFEKRASKTQNLGKQESEKRATEKKYFKDFKDLERKRGRKFDALETLKGRYPEPVLEAWEAYLLMRQETGKPITSSRALDAVIRNLDEVAASDDERIAVIDRATSGCYCRFIGLPKPKPSTPQRSSGTSKTIALPEWYSDIPTEQATEADIQAVLELQRTLFGNKKDS